jgi:predicted membrane protein
MGRIVAGVIILLCGVVILLNTLGVTDLSIGDLFATFFWPVFFIAVGASFLTTRRPLSFGRLLAGVVLIALGLLYLGDQLNWFHVDIGDVWQLFWPVILILVGLNLLFGLNYKGRRRDPSFGTAGGGDQKWDLKGGDIWAVFGGVDLDLRNANIPEGETVLRPTAIMGSVQIIVPPNLAVVCKGTAAFGSLHFFGRNHGGILTTVQDQQGSTDGAGKVVYILCNSIFGSVKVYTRG